MDTGAEFSAAACVRRLRRNALHSGCRAWRGRSSAFPSLPARPPTGGGAQIEAMAAWLQALVVVLVEQVAELQSCLRAGAGEFDPPGPGAVVEDELVVAAAAALAGVEFLALVAGQHGGVLVALQLALFL